jgi:hypothetical protein
MAFERHVGNAAALWATLHLGDDFALGSLQESQAVHELTRYAVDGRTNRE